MNEPIASLAEYAAPIFAQSQNLKLAVRYSLHAEPFERHCHRDFYELVLVRGGQAVHQLDDHAYPIGPGMIFLIHPQVYHSYTQTRELGIYNIIFGLPLLRQLQNDLGGFANFHLLFRPLPGKSSAPALTMSEKYFLPALELLEDIMTEQQNNQRGCRTAILSDFMRVILLICRHAQVENTAQQLQHGWKLSQLLARLDAECHKEWSLEKMAKTTNLSVSSFRQQFRRMTGLPPAEYLLELRLKKAAAMLLRDQIAISNISRSCGFADSNYFARQFRRRYGFSPREFRAQGGGV